MRWTISKLGKPGSAHLGGLNWVGRNDQGISMWRGMWRTIPKWFCNLFKALGVGLICLATIFAVTGLWQAVPGPLIAGCFHSVLGFVILERFRNRMNGLVSAEQVAEQFGKSVEEVKRAVEAEGIKPTYILNDEPIYALHAFGDAGILLRSSEPPQESDETLLRAVGPGSPASDSNHLLRPTDDTPYIHTAAVDVTEQTASLLNSNSQSTS
jgi:hypothetical protein